MFNLLLQLIKHSMFNLLLQLSKQNFHAIFDYKLKFFEILTENILS